MTQCSNKRRAAGLAYPRTCSVCGLGPCRETTALNPPEPTTNTVKHTPGPWFVGGVRQKVDGQEALGIFRYDEAKKRDLNIASVWYDRRDGAGTNDARLIAAAPDLLEALHVVGMSAGWQYLTFETRALIEAAISKATGSPAPQEKGGE